MAGCGGRIGFVGDAAGALRFAGGKGQVWELGGCWIVPGFIDSHVHVHGAALERDSVDLSACASPAECVARLARANARQRLADGEWLLGHGWSDAAWSTLPDRSWLDAALPECPVALRRVDAHAWWVNTAALVASRVGTTPPDIAGGRVERRAGGETTGVLVDKAADVLRAAIPSPPLEKQVKALQAQLSWFASQGLTGVHDMWLSEMGAHAYRAVAAAGPLPLRVRGYVDGEAAGYQRWWAAPWGPDEVPGVVGDADVRLRGFKLFADGALGSRGAALREPYCDAPEHAGLLVHAPEDLAARMEGAARAGFQLAVHAIGDRGLAAALDAVATLRRRGINLWRPRIEHAQIASPLDVERMAALGMAAAVQPVHAHSDAPWVAARLGAARVPWAYRWRSLVQAGVPLGLGSDYPVDNGSPLAGLASVRVRPWALRAAEGTECLAGDPEALDPFDAVVAHTAGAAWLSGDEGVTGCLRPGWAADFVALDRDPLATAPENLHTTRVVLTVCAGRPTYGS